MRRLIGTKELPKDEWLRIRKQGICGTDAGAIVGLNPYRSAFDPMQDTAEHFNLRMKNTAEIEAKGIDLLRREM